MATPSRAQLALNVPAEEPDVTGPGAAKAKLYWRRRRAHKANYEDFSYFPSRFLVRPDMDEARKFEAEVTLPRRARIPFTYGDTSKFALVPAGKRGGQLFDVFHASVGELRDFGMSINLYFTVIQGLGYAALAMAGTMTYAYLFYR